jgi:basic membrane protein A
MKGIDTAVYAIIRDSMNGTLDAGTIMFTAETEGIRLAPYHEAEAAIPLEAKDLLEDIYEQFKAGTLDTGVDELGDIID